MRHPTNSRFLPKNSSECWNVGNALSTLPPVVESPSPMHDSDPGKSRLCSYVLMRRGFQEFYLITDKRRSPLKLSIISLRNEVFEGVVGTRGHLYYSGIYELYCCLVYMGSPEPELKSLVH